MAADAAARPHGAVAAYGQGAITEITEDGNIGSHNSVVVNRDASGNVTGNLVAHIDLAAFGLGVIHLGVTLDCLRVHGNRAWFSGTTTSSSDTGVAPLGTPVVGYVTDRPGRPDSLQIEPLAISCKDRPRLTQWPIESGDFDVTR